MRSVQVYVEGQRIELFNDEKIQVTSSVQNISDISKVFTDFSQTFTVPASPHNNRLFEHFYNSDVDGTLDYQTRRDSYIEIELNRFRKGRLQLEKSNLKDGQPYSYTVVFYGDVRTLKDLIGEIKLSELDFSAYTHTYNGTEVYNRVNGSTDYDIRYPLISSNRVWDYNGVTPANNIDVTAGRIDYTELFPAIKIARIFDAIETYTGVTFQGAFLLSKRFDNCFLHCKASNQFAFISEPKDLDIISTTDSSYFNVTTNKLSYQYVTLTQSGETIVNAFHKTDIVIFNTSVPTAVYYLDVYSNGVLVNTIQGNGNASYNVQYDQNTTGLNEVLTFKLRSNQPLTFKAAIIYTLVGTKLTGGGSNVAFFETETGFCSTNMTTTGNINIQSLMPDIKVTDWLSGVLKEFNLTCYPTEDNVFQVEPLDDWYTKGRIIDITEHTDLDSIDVERVKLYKKISFEHEVSKSFMNVSYKDAFQKEYGDLGYSYPYDGDEYTVKVPFENVLFQQFTGTNLQVAYYLERDTFKPYIPKPVLLYLYDSVSCSPFKIYTGSVEQTISAYRPFGQDLIENGIKYSLNFGNDQSSLFNTNIVNGLFNVYYYGYLNNLYTRKNRITYVKTFLPISILTSLKLNDRLVIRDKRYIINEMTSDLTSGVVNLVLLNDFRPLRIKRPVRTGGGFIKVPILLPNKVKSAFIDTTGTGVTASIDTFTSDGVTELTVPTNADPIEERITEDSIQRITEQGEVRWLEGGADESYYIPITYTYENGDTETDYILIEIE